MTSRRRQRREKQRLQERLATEASQESDCECREDVLILAELEHIDDDPWTVDDYWVDERDEWEDEPYDPPYDPFWDEPYDDYDDVCGNPPPGIPKPGTHWRDGEGLFWLALEDGRLASMLTGEYRYPSELSELEKAL